MFSLVYYFTVLSKAFSNGILAVNKRFLLASSQNALSLRTKNFKASIIWVKDALLTIRKNKHHKHLNKRELEGKEIIEDKEDIYWCIFIMFYL